MEGPWGASHAHRGCGPGGQVSSTPPPPLTPLPAPVPVDSCGVCCGCSGALGHPPVYTLRQIFLAALCSLKTLVPGALRKEPVAQGKPLPWAQVPRWCTAPLHLPSFSPPHPTPATSVLAPQLHPRCTLWGQARIRIVRFMTLHAVHLSLTTEPTTGHFQGLHCPHLIDRD